MKILHRLEQILFFTAITFLVSGFVQKALASKVLHEDVTVHFSSMNPHLNQNLYLRVVDIGTMKETARTTQLISSADFDITLSAVEIGKSYFIDFFADFNTNGLYDNPPTDHAWRLELDNAAGNDTLSFTHNTNFTDIKWVYLLTINFTDMTPHVGQQLELRVENNNTNKEIDRIKIASIPSANFNVQIVGIKLNIEYKTEFYADFNGNENYDSPPTDHAWEIDFTNTTGDVSLDFSHNTNFTDINWKYLLTIDFKSMSPHLNQLFELRVVQQDNDKEIDRVSLPAILVPDFSVYVPGIEIEHDYNIDFYADFNGNKMYDSPPTDHAWRLTFTSTTGNVTEDFTHNTNFTDIQWPGQTAVNDPDETVNSFSLKQNFPNPFNPSTSIQFTLPASSFVTLKIFNILGKEVSTLINEERPAGNYEVEFSAKDKNGTQLESGIYLYQLKSDNFIETKKMVLLK